MDIAVMMFFRSFMTLAAAGRRCGLHSAQARQTTCAIEIECERAPTCISWIRLRRAMRHSFMQQCGACTVTLFRAVSGSKYMVADGIRSHSTTFHYTGTWLCKKTDSAQEAQTKKPSNVGAGIAKKR